MKIITLYTDGDAPRSGTLYRITYRRQGWTNYTSHLARTSSAAARYVAKLRTPAPGLKPVVSLKVEMTPTVFMEIDPDSLGKPKATRQGSHVKGYRKTGLRNAPIGPKAQDDRKSATPLADAVRRSAGLEP